MVQVHVAAEASNLPGLLQAVPPDWGWSEGSRKQGLGQAWLHFSIPWWRWGPRRACALDSFGLWPLGCCGGEAVALKQANPPPLED